MPHQWPPGVSPRENKGHSDRDTQESEEITRKLVRRLEQLEAAETTLPTGGDSRGHRGEHSERGVTRAGEYY
jgi:hypothetical protein